MRWLIHRKRYNKMPMCRNDKETVILAYSGENKREAVKKAAEIIKAGGLVAFPTETVYGLGADAFNKRAVEHIFTVKGRPVDNPLIVHIAAYAQVEMLTSRRPPEVGLLAEKFWPGPLTVILNRKAEVPAAVSAGLSTVAVRIPGHPAALELIREAGTPIAAPSANLSGKPSPTEGSHVTDDLSGRIEAVLDGGSCTVGLESTVLDLTGQSPVILRPGGVTAEELEACLQKPVLAAGEENAEKPLSPGTKYRHYSPEAGLLLFRGDRGKIQNKMKEYFCRLTDGGKKVGILCTEENKHIYPGAVAEILGKQANPGDAAAALYRALRNLDRSGVDVILAESFKEEGIGTALMNRLQKAAEQIIDVT